MSRAPDRLIVKVLALAVQVLLGLAIGEVVLRLIGPVVAPQLALQLEYLTPAARGERVADKMLVRDPDLGYRMQAGRTVAVQFRADLPTTRITTNRLGFRGPLVDPAPIVVVGDSFAFGSGVDDEATSVAVLQRSLGRPVVNFGMVGFNPDQYNRALRHYALRVSPRTVLYYLFAGNDFLEPQVLDDARPSDQSRAGAALQWGNNFLSPLATFQVVKWALRMPSYRYGGRKIQDGRFDMYFSFNDSPFDLARPGIRRSFETVVENLARAERASAGAGAAIVFVLIPTRESVYRALGLRHGIEPRHFEAQDALMQALDTTCRQRAWSCLDLTGPLRARTERDPQLYYPIDGHWTAAGNIAAAESIAAFLAEKGLVARP